MKSDLYFTQKLDTLANQPLVSEYLYKQRAVIKMRKAEFKECFDICYQNFEFALELAKEGSAWHPVSG